MDSLISIIVPIYNAEKYLDRCIESILNQTYKNLEIILVDDGSTDNSPEKCDRYSNIDSRIKVIHKKNGGVCSARNAGLDICQGEYIGFVDSDDWIESSMYENLISACEKKNIIVTIGSYNATENGKIVPKRVFLDKVVSRHEFLRNILCQLDGCSVGTRLFPREIIGDKRFNEERLNEEILFWMSILPKIEGVSYIPNIGYYYFQRDGSLSHQFGKSVHDMIDNSEKVRLYVNETFPTLSKEAERFEIFQHMNFLICCPANYDRASDSIYKNVLLYIRKNIIIGLQNPYLNGKDKIKLVSVAIAPRLFSIFLTLRYKWIRQKKNYSVDL